MFVIYNMIVILLFPLWVFVIGLCIGSFLNVVICRLKTKESILFTRSHCPECKNLLKWFEMVPVLSFLLQGGKCRSCGRKINWQYIWVETATGCLFLHVIDHGLQITNLNLTDLVSTLLLLVIVCFLVIIFVYDLKHYIIPDKIVYPAILVALAFNLFTDLYSGHLLFSIDSSTVNGLLAAFLAGGFFLSLILVSKGKWMGLGDVKLAALMGLILGWPNILLALFLASLLGAIVGIILVLRGMKSMKSQVPFGPFLVSATLLSIFYGHQIVGWYLSTLSLY